MGSRSRKGSKARSRARRGRVRGEEGRPLPSSRRQYAVLSAVARFAPRPPSCRARGGTTGPLRCVAAFGASAACRLWSVMKSPRHTMQPWNARRCGGRGLSPFPFSGCFVTGQGINACLLRASCSLPTSTHSPVRARARVRARSREANSTRVLPAPAECGHLESHAYAVSITGPIFCQLCRGPSEPAVGISVDSECMRAFCSSILMQACREFPYQHICWRRPACQVATKSRPSSMSH